MDAGLARNVAANRLKWALKHEEARTKAIGLKQFNLDHERPIKHTKADPTARQAIGRIK